MFSGHGAHKQCWFTLNTFSHRSLFSIRPLVPLPPFSSFIFSLHPACYTHPSALCSLRLPLLTLHSFFSVMNGQVFPRIPMAVLTLHQTIWQVAASQTPLSTSPSVHHPGQSSVSNQCSPSGAVAAALKSQDCGPHSEHSETICTPQT